MVHTSLSGRAVLYLALMVAVLSLILGILGEMGAIPGDMFRWSVSAAILLLALPLWQFGERLYRLYPPTAVGTTLFLFVSILLLVAKVWGSALDWIAILVTQLLGFIFMALSLVYALNQSKFKRGE